MEDSQLFSDSDNLSYNSEEDYLNDDDETGRKHTRNEGNTQQNLSFKSLSPTSSSFSIASTKSIPAMAEEDNDDDFDISSLDPDQFNLCRKPLSPSFFVIPPILTSQISSPALDDDDPQNVSDDDNSPLPQLSPKESKVMNKKEENKEDDLECSADEVEDDEDKDSNGKVVGSTARTESAVDCSLCSETVNGTQPLIKYHIETKHWDDGSYECMVCRQSFAYPFHVLAHAAQQHCPISLSDNAVDDDDQIDNAVEQFMTASKDIRSILSKTASDIVAVRAISYRVMSNYHQSIIKPQTQIRLFCQLCQKYLSRVNSNSMLKDRQISHVNNVHLDVKRFKCSECSYQALQNDRLWTHISLTHRAGHQIDRFEDAGVKNEITKAVEALLDKAFLEADRIKKDRVAMTYRQPLFCQVCEAFVSGRGVLLKRHAVSHFERGTFRCPMCRRDLNSSPVTPVCVKPARHECTAKMTQSILFRALPSTKPKMDERLKQTKEKLVLEAQMQIECFGTICTSYNRNNFLKFAPSDQPPVDLTSEIRIEWNRLRVALKVILINYSRYGPKANRRVQCHLPGCRVTVNYRWLSAQDVIESPSLYVLEDHLFKHHSSKVRKLDPQDNPDKLLALAREAFPNEMNLFAPPLSETIEDSRLKGQFEDSRHGGFDESKTLTNESSSHSNNNNNNQSMVTLNGRSNNNQTTETFVEPVSQRNFTCSLCHKAVPPNNLYQHAVIDHFDERMIECPHCEKKEKYQSRNIRVHMERVHQGKGGRPVDRRKEFRNIIGHIRALCFWQKLAEQHSRRSVQNNR